MTTTARSYLTAGVAALGAGAIALSPVQPIPNQVAPAQEKAVANLAVTLASTIDPITPIVETFQTSVANIKTLTEFYLQKPFPLLQTTVANLGTYAAELEAGDGALIPDQIKNNIQTFFQAPWSPGAQARIDAPTTPPSEVALPLGEYVSETLNGGDIASPKDLNFILLQVVAGASLDPAAWPSVAPLVPLWNFLNTPYSGQLLGVLGPLLSPLVQLTKSFTAVGAYFQAGDVAGAINELINIPTATTNAFLNGAGFLNLGPILSKIVGPDSLVPTDNLGVNLGGLLNAMPRNGSLVPPPVTDPPTPADPPTEWSGGVALDGLAGALVLPDSPPGDTGVKFPGIKNGWFGSVIGLGQFLSEQLLVTPPAPGQAVAPAAAEADPVAADIEAAAEAPAPQAVSAPSPAKAAAASDNDGNAGGGGRTHHTAARGNNAG